MWKSHCHNTHLRGESCTEMAVTAEYYGILFPSSPQNSVDITVTGNVTNCPSN